MVKTGTAWAGSFVTLDATGAVTAATGTPVGVLYVDGTANGATVTITGSNPYKWAVTLPSLTAGQRVDMYITGTIDSIATAGFVASEQADTKITSDIEATLTAMKGAGWTTETLAAIAVLIDAIKLKTDALDVSSVTVVTAVVGSTITILRGDTLSAPLLNLGSMASYVSLDFTIKLHTYDTDDDALIRVRKNASGLLDGLMRLNGAAHTTGTDGSITITDAPTGDITIMLKATVTDDLAPGTYVYDVQLIEAAEVTTLTTGILYVSPDVTRLVA